MKDNESRKSRAQQLFQEGMQNVYQNRVKFSMESLRELTVPKRKCDTPPVSRFFQRALNNGDLRGSLLQTLYLIESGAAFHTTSLPTYQKLMEFFKVPQMDRRTLGGPFLRIIHQGVKNILLQMISVSCDAFSITFDCWSDIGRKNSFLAVTRHFTPKNAWELKTVVLDVIPFTGRHTAQSLAQKIGERLQNMKNSLLYFGVTDNASNVSKALSLLLTSYRREQVVNKSIEDECEESKEEKEEKEDDDDEHAPDSSSIYDDIDQIVAVEDEDHEEDITGFHCACHTLDLVVHHAIDSVPIVTEDVLSIRNIVVAIKASTQMQEKLHIIQQDCQNRQYDPILDVRTRWNSTLFMLQRFELIAGDIACLFKEKHFDEKLYYFPNAEARARLSQYILILQDFEQASRFLEGEKYETIAHLPQIIFDLFDKLTSPMQVFPHVTKFRQALLSQMENRFSDLLTSVNPSLLAAAVHPYHGHLSFLSEELRDQVWNAVTEWGISLFEDDVRPLDEEEDSDVSEQERALIRILQKSSDSTKWRASLDLLRKRFESSSHREQWKFDWRGAKKNQLKSQCHDKAHLRKYSEFYLDDLNGKRQLGKEGLFTYIHPLVKMVMSLPASTAPVERVFSACAFLKPAARARLGPNILEYLTVIRYYIKSPYFDFEMLLNEISALIFHAKKVDCFFLLIYLTVCAG